MSLRNELLNHFKAIFPEWENGGESERFAAQFGKKMSNASRRCRELCNDGKLERQLRAGKNGIRTVWYRYIPDRPPQVLEQYRKEIISVTQPLFTRAQI